MTTIVRPYGDTTGDGMTQVSFTLPIPHDKKAEGAALQLAGKMGLDPAMLVHAKQIGEKFTFFVVYGSVKHLVNLDEVQVVERDFPLLSAKEINTVIKQRLRRKLSVVGACIGTDAHTVGIDAILNIKGIAGEKGLEYYREMKVVNMGAQVTVPELVARAKAEKADAVLVSQVVTQKDAHLHNTREMSAAFREALPAGRRPLLIVGGPRFDELMAGELGVDRIFGRGTTPREVASYLVHQLITQRATQPASAKGESTLKASQTASPKGDPSTAKANQPVTTKAGSPTAKAEPSAPKAKSPARKVSQPSTVAAESSAPKAESPTREADPPVPEAGPDSRAAAPRKGRVAGKASPAAQQDQPRDQEAVRLVKQRSAT